MNPAYLQSIHHDGSPRYVQTSGRAGLHLGDTVTIRLRAAPDAPIERALLRTCPDGEQFFTEMRPEDAQPNPACRWWQATLKLGMPVTAYRFLLFTADGSRWLNGSGLHRHVPTDAEDFRLLSDADLPGWAPGSVFYQVFPDRFADGDPSNNVRDGEYTHEGVATHARDWGQPPGTWPQSMAEFYGGDLDGIAQRLDYLSDLGVNALYLNPIFSAYSNHRYDVTNYDNVDTHLGGNAALVRLRHALDKRGMRVILDIVPNHCGVMHPWFQAALRDAAAPTAEYFTFHDHPHDYACWLGVRGLPKLNYRSAALREAIYAGADSVFRRWLRAPYRIDGWRVDVANMLARHGRDQLEAGVWSGIRAAVKDENPAAYLLGENFFDGSPQLQGDALDATMNYAGFTHPLLYWLGRFEVGQHAEPRHVASAVRWPTEALVDTWQAHRAAIPWALACQQFNLLGSHDTPRFSQRLGGDQAHIRLAAAFLLTYVGVPCIYYGDEIGLQPSTPFEARDCMAWDPARWDLDMRGYFQALIRLRRQSPALAAGGFQVLHASEEVLAYQRDAEDQRVIVIGNRGPAQPDFALPVAHGAIADGAAFSELFSGRRAVVSAGSLPVGGLPAGAQVWVGR